MPRGIWVTHISLVRKAKLMYILAARVFANTMAAASSGETFTGQARELIILLDQSTLCQRSS